MKNRNLIGVIGILGFLFFAAASANATVIDFEDLGVATGTQFDPNDNVVIQSGGFNFVNGPLSIAINDLHFPNGTSNSISGTTELLAHGDLISMESTGALFSLNSFDFGSVFGEVSFSVIGTYGAGGTTTAYFTPDFITSTLETFTLDSSFTNLVSVNWLHQGGSQGLFNLDNIVVNNSVPEPATLLLFGTGLAGLIGGSGIRRKKKA